MNILLLVKKRKEKIMTQQKTLYGRITNHDESNVFLRINNLAEEAYKTENVEFPDGWNFIKSSRKNRFISNFKAIVLEKDDRYAIVLFGTDVKSGRDIWTDAKMAVNGTPKQFKDALKFTKSIMNQYGISPSQIDLIGNSEGGSEGMYIMSQIPDIAHGTFFNPYTPAFLDVDEETQTRIDCYRHPKDIISKMGIKIGNEYIVDYKDDFKRNKGLPEFVEAHRINNLGDLKNSIHIDEYIEKNPEFKNKYRQGVLKSYEIAEIPDEVYPLADQDINDRLKNGMVVNEEKPKTSKTEKSTKSSACVGSYAVSGYTRSNGTYVADYTRSCGFPHNGTNI